MTASQNYYCHLTSDTPVQMADRTTKPISQVQAGDKVKSRDPKTGAEGAKTVTATIKRLAPAVVTVCLSDAKSGKIETLTCTPEHPLYVQGQGWVEAGSLGIGSSIVSRAGPLLSVQSVTWQRHQETEKAGQKASGTGGFGGFTVYNLTVEDDHTFFVGNVGGGTWVHNVCRGRPDNVTIPNGNAKGGWQHIEEGHITGVQPGGDIFETTPTRAELEDAANTIVRKGQRISDDPSLPVQTFQDRMNIAGTREQYRAVIHMPSKTVISIFPFRDSM